jgi:signal recognition particle subunit SRP54
MAFETLSEKFQRIFKRLKGQNNLSESNMEEMLGEIKVALLDADVNYKVVKKFLNEVKEKAIGQQVLLKVNPSQMITKIVHDELVALLGSNKTEIQYNKNKPTVIMLVGLQGTGKTTTAAKLAYLMKNKLNKKVLFAACDIYRPAAVAQLKTLASSLKMEVVHEEGKSAVEIANLAKTKAYNDHYDVLIIDTAGRLQIDETLMDELNDIKSSVNPEEILLLVDAMSGQDAVNVALAFNERLALTGAILSKLDGDARGGSALSIAHLTGVCIKFAGVGEKVSDLDIFYPDRMADRILGMGDVVSLVETVQANIDEREAKRQAMKLMKGTFTLDDMLKQLKQIQKMGSLGGLLAMIPGMPRLTDAQKEAAEKEMINFEVIMDSMTLEERAHPEILKNSRKVRIAKGSGKTAADINRMLNKYEQAKQMMKQMRSGGGLPPFMRGRF